MNKWGLQRKTRRPFIRATGWCIPHGIVEKSNMTIKKNCPRSGMASYKKNIAIVEIQTAAYYS